MDIARNTVSSSKADHLKMRLVNGLHTAKFVPENQRNFLAPIQRKPGYKTSLPGARFNQKEIIEASMEGPGTPHHVKKLVPDAFRNHNRTQTV